MQDGLFAATRRAVHQGDTGIDGALATAQLSGCRRGACPSHAGGDTCAAATSKLKGDSRRRFCLGLGVSAMSPDRSGGSGWGRGHGTLTSM